MAQSPNAFISYSHSDRNKAMRVARGLRETGIEVWLDRWEILPGDSLIRKVFEEGIAGADAFLILLSENSVESRWVKEELDAALIKRMDGITRVIPVIIDNVEVPLQLRALMWVDMTDDFDAALRQLQAAIFGVRERPPVGEPPEFVKDYGASVGGLSRIATALGSVLSSTGKAETGNEARFTASELKEMLEFSPEETDDAIDELESLGLVKTLNYFGTHPFRHGEVWPTYALFLHFRGHGLDYDPEEDIRVVASTIAAKKKIDGEGIRKRTKLSPLRINRAVAYLEDYGLARVIKEFGAPFDFGEVWATAATRRFVAEKCR